MPTGSGTVTLTVTTDPADATVLASSSPLGASIVVVGAVGCQSAIGTIDPANHTLTISLPTGCNLTANTSVGFEIPSVYFAPNPAAGTTVVYSVATSADTDPQTAATYTVGVISFLQQCCTFGCLSFPSSFVELS